MMIQIFRPMKGKNPSTSAIIQFEMIIIFVFLVDLES